MDCRACGYDVKEGTELVKNIIVCEYCFNDAPLVDDKDFLVKWVEKRQESIMQMVFVCLIDYITYKNWSPSELIESGLLVKLQKEAFDLESDANKAINLIDEKQSLIGKILQHQIRLLDYYMEKEND